jgi:hypothetical protein
MEDTYGLGQVLAAIRPRENRPEQRVGRICSAPTGHVYR